MSVMLARVSHIESFRRWREDEDSTAEDLVRQITEDTPTPAMLTGTAFHRALELAEVGDYETLQANGYTFHLPEGEVALPSIREMRGYKDYGPLTVTGQIDGIHGRTIVDHKTTGRIDFERYLSGAQWKFYLEIFGADIFRWHIFEIDEVAPMEYRVAAPQVLTAYRYPDMPTYCAQLANDFLAFAHDFLPERFT